MKNDSRNVLALRCQPQQLLASVTEGVQRFQEHLKSHPLIHEPLHATKAAFPKQQVSQRTREATSKKTALLVEDEGVMVAVQARNNVHRAAVLLGAAVVGKLSRLGNKLKEHHVKMREEGEVRKQARRADRSMDHHNPLKLAFPWQRKRRRGPHNENGIFRMGGARATAEALIKKGKEHEREMDVRAALRCYEDANKLVPNTVDTLCLAAKAWSDVTYLDEIETNKREGLSIQDKQNVNLKAMEYAKQAITMSPTRALPHVACCISMGRMAVFSDNKTKVRYAKEAREHAVIALEKEPGNDLAHHLMGRWHWEMANINGIVRALIRIMYGTDLATGSHAAALHHYRKAAELNPHRLVHRVEIGRSLARMGERERALEELEHAVTLDVEDINAHLQKVDAELLVKDLRKSVKRRPSSALGTDTTASGDAHQQGTGAQLPWNWKLPQLQNPFAQQAVETARPRTEPTPAVNAAPSSAAAPPQPGPASPAVPVKQDVASRTKLPLRQNAAERVQRPGWRMGSRGEKDREAASSNAPSKKVEQQQQGGFLGLRLPQWRNPLDGWGKRVAPVSA
ncbi:probable regulator of microtubule dynamics protein 3 [Coccomyxa sp. Obi]|nr:probable regulator of microtubule dynamics protein 3 [Coccomyxa sp. Obi]